MLVVVSFASATPWLEMSAFEKKRKYSPEIKDDAVLLCPRLVGCVVLVVLVLVWFLQLAEISNPVSQQQ